MASRKSNKLFLLVEETVLCLPLSGISLCSVFFKTVPVVDTGLTTVPQLKTILTEELKDVSRETARNKSCPVNLPTHSM